MVEDEFLRIEDHPDQVLEPLLAGGRGSRARAGFGQVGINLWDVLGNVEKMSPEKKARGLKVEILNGRAAMMGLRPIVEFMSWSFSLVAADQILDGASRRTLGQLGGSMSSMLAMASGPERAMATFTIRAPEGIKLEVEARHQRAGRQRVTVRLA